MDQLKRKAFEQTAADIIRRNVDGDAAKWLREKAEALHNENKTALLNSTFAAVPRKTGKAPITISDEDKVRLQLAGDGLSVDGWTVDRLARVWLLMQANAEDKETYIPAIENLFRSAEMNEGVALYSSLYLLHYPEAWQFRATEGIRSNIGTILEALMYENPYPSKYLNQLQWNQLVLKAFFTEKDVNRIIGLDERANEALASILVDYAHERWAAHRSVDPRLWRLVARFIGPENFTDIQKLISSGADRERKAAGLACAESKYAPAHNLLKQYPDLETAIRRNEINWVNF